MKWKVKLGAEARPETVATRLVWAHRLFRERRLLSSGLPGQRYAGDHLKRRNARICRTRRLHQERAAKRNSEGEKKIGTWQWRHNPFTGTRELNGLRVMMALINNWDLKDENNAGLPGKEFRGRRGPLIYMVSDLGASFGTTNFVQA